MDRSRFAGDFPGDDGQGFHALLDQIADAVEDLQNVRLTRIRQPVAGIRSKGKSVNVRHRVRSQFYQ